MEASQDPEEPGETEKKGGNLVTKGWNMISFTPRRCRWNPPKPPEFKLGLNILYSFAAAFSVANLYYNHPILNILAEDFGVTDEKASIIPTVMQAGYAAGLFFLCPLGDILRRRAFVLTLTWLTATMVGLNFILELNRY
ncbi:MAG: hypothetical protein Q9225_008073 [Loekoesia sp. 1 TL-2023]